MSAAPYIQPTVPSGQVLGSQIIRTLFNCPPSIVVADDIAVPLRAAGINAISFQCFNSPANNASLTNYSLWEAAWESQVRPAINYCSTNNWLMHLMGDEFMRTVGERAWLHGGGFVQQAVEYVAAETADATGMDVVDEIGTDPTQYDAGDFIDWWRGAGGCPLAWPQEARLTPPNAWETAGRSDYSSRFVTELEWRHGRSDGNTTWQHLRMIQRAYEQVPTARPWWCLVGIMGPFYRKYVHGVNYAPGLDYLLRPGTRPANIIAHVWLALAYGASGLRVYGYDFGLWRGERSGPLYDPEGPPEQNPGQLQTGGAPGDVRWSAMSRAFNAIASREVSLLGLPYTPIVSGPWVFGRRGSLVWGVNTAERALPSPNGPGTILTPAGESTSSTVPAAGVILWG
jgi:hypothetical protein